MLSQVFQRRRNPRLCALVASVEDLALAADGVANPTGVRHLYQEPYRGCLYNEVNLPAGPFCIMLKSWPWRRNESWDSGR